MGWLDRIRPSGPREEGSSEEEAPAHLDRAAPGVAALLDSMGEGGHAVLDMGRASPQSFRVYSRFARRIRFADLLTESPPEGWSEALRRLPRFPEQPYDVVVAWNVLDHMAPEERPAVVERLVELTGPGARLYAVTDTSGEAHVQRVRFSLLDREHVREEVVGAPHPAWPKLLPAEVERLLKPFRVAQAFVLRRGMREYMAVRR